MLDYVIVQAGLELHSLHMPYYLAGKLPKTLTKLGYEIFRRGRRNIAHKREITISTNIKSIVTTFKNEEESLSILLSTDN